MSDFPAFGLRMMVARVRDDPDFIDALKKEDVRRALAAALDNTTPTAAAAAIAAMRRAFLESSPTNATAKIQPDHSLFIKRRGGQSFDVSFGDVRAKISVWTRGELIVAHILAPLDVRIVRDDAIVRTKPP